MRLSMMLSRSLCFFLMLGLGLVLMFSNFVENISSGMCSGESSVGNSISKWLSFGS